MLKKGASADQVAEGYFVPDTGDGSSGILPANFVEKCTPSTGANGEYYGKCILSNVSNFYRDPTKPAADGAAANGIVQQHQVRFIHYPDCQQLSFHMPKYAYDAGTLRLINSVTGEVLEEMPVRDKLNGSTNILWDTLPFKPGFYTLEADWPDGWTHRIKFIKFMEGFPKAETYEHPAGNVAMVQNSREHRLFDSNGVEIDNGMQAIREATEQVIRRIKRQAVITGMGRGGIIEYVDGNVRFQIDFEVGAGNCVVLIFVPGEQQWEKATGTLLAERSEILEFIAQAFIRQQASSCHYVIKGDVIEILR